MAGRKTVLFEEKYGVDIRNFHSTKEIDKVVENKIGRKLKVVKVGSRVVSSGRGNIFKIRKYGINKRFKKAIRYKQKIR
jgi:hypothetical protein